MRDAITPDYFANDLETLEKGFEKREKRRGRKRARYYHEQSRTNSGYLLLPGLPLNLPSPLLAGRLPTILYVVHFREADRSLAGRAFRLHDLAVHLCKRRTDRDELTYSSHIWRTRKGDTCYLRSSILQRKLESFKYKILR